MMALPQLQTALYQRIVRTIMVAALAIVALPQLRVNISENTASWGGGGIDNENKVMVASTTIYGNSAGSGGGVMNHGGAATIMDSIISKNAANNEGGGIIDCTFGSITSVTRSIISDNSAGVRAAALNLVNAAQP